MAGLLPEEIEEALESEVSAIMHAPDFACFEVRKGACYERLRFVGFDVLGAGCLVERFDLRAQRYEGTAAFDATGIGNVVADLLNVTALGKVLVGRDWQGDLTRDISGVESGRIATPGGYSAKPSVPGATAKRFRSRTVFCTPARRRGTGCSRSRCRGCEGAGSTRQRVRCRLSGSRSTVRS